MFTDLKKQLQENIEELKTSGLYKVEREIDSPQQSHIESANRDLLNFCANNYLGLANDDRVIEAAREILAERGFGVASVRFICGTQDIHKELEQEVSKFLGTDDTILFSSCFDANGGVFEALFGESDAIISDELNLLFGCSLTQLVWLLYQQEILLKHYRLQQSCRYIVS